MNMDTNDLLNNLLSNMPNINYARSVDFPNIDLYMDQVTSFMEKQLNSTKRYEEDKVLTKTMINNYAKNDLLPAPVKKKYSKEHLLLLTFIYYFKSFLSMKDIEMILRPLTQKYFATDSKITIADIYDEICMAEKELAHLTQQDIEKMYNNSLETFTNAEEEDKQILQLFTFICSLSYDVYIKKLLIEKLIDQIPAPVCEEADKEKDKDKKKK